MINGTRCALVVLCAWFAGAAMAAEPVGMLETDGVVEVSAPGAGSSTLRATEYAFHSGDLVHARSGSTVLNLNGGGGLGLPEKTQVRVTAMADGGYRVELIAGTLLYAFPDTATGFEFKAGEFTVSALSDTPQALQVSSESGGHVGMLELLKGGNLKASVRSGRLQIRGSTARVEVAAGETVGLMALPEPVSVQLSLPPVNERISIQSPERVGTNDEFTIRWDAPKPMQGDYVVIAKTGAEPDEFVTMISSDEGQVLEFTAPDRPGDYEIRFIDGESGEIVEFVYLDVVEDIIAAYWWDNNPLGPIWGVAAGAVGVYLITRDGDKTPVSP
ncbi:MAG: hypothetical protein Kow0020_14220 [Wenzhouxiangellaceae bacterium]